MPSSFPFHNALMGWVASACLALTFAGCASVSDDNGDYINPGTTDMVVERLEFRGVENVSERQLRQGLATVEDPGWRGQSPWHYLPIVGDRPRYFNRFAWRQDRERILGYYRQQGYYHASIQSESIIEDPERNTVRIRVTIDEGEPTTVSDIELHGLIQGETPTRSELIAELPLREGGLFIQEDYRSMRTALRNRLENAGHAYAEVSGRVFIDSESKQADVFFFLEPGPRSQMGPVYILGLEDIDENAVRQAIPFRHGQPYTPGQLTRTQEELYDLGVFGMVTVLPAHQARDTTVESEREQRRLDSIIERHDLEDPSRTDDDPDGEIQPDGPSPHGISDILGGAQRQAESRSRLDPEVPIVIRVQEATGYNLRVGAGLAAEGTRQDVRGLLNWTSRNFLGGLRRLEHFNALGHAWAPGVVDPINRGIILSSELRFQQPQFFEPRTNLRLRARVTRDVEEGFSVWNPSFRIAIDRPFFDHVIAGASYNAAYFNYFNIDESLVSPAATDLGLDFQEEFLLEYFEQSLAYDRRNDVINPTSGYVVDLTAQQAGSYVIGGEFDFIKPVISAQSYIPFELFDHSVLALRSRLGAVYDIGRDSTVPYQSRVYSGGSDGMRSFGRRRLSLYTPDQEAIPIGGHTQFEASIEPRFRLLQNLLDIGDVWGAVFIDSATVLREQFLFDTSPSGQGVADLADLPPSLLYGAGAGAWWNTPVGPVRLDFAYTLSDITEDRRFRRCQNPANYGTPQCEFVPIDEDPIQNLILGYGIYLSIGHSF